MDAKVPYAPVTALLGPTNTGKTHRAVERLLEHATGMIGLPLRLLAREVYDRITARVGERSVALVTGEEKRIPEAPRYFVATVEAMPIDREVDFVAIDEIQLMAHPQRGHVFTARLLGARGTRETWFLGSETARPLVERLLPVARIASYPRLSRLSGAGVANLRGLPPRSAVVAFSPPQVYELAARVRAARGGAAVVLGGMSPRTRNAQVALYQAGEVDYLVATDAIGMGLNLDVEHVAFAATTKFDGREARPLEVAELAQIAGRAGRYLADGSFGTLAPLPALPEAVVAAIEEHRFPPLRAARYRNTELDQSSLDALIASLLERPPRSDLRPVDRAMDLAVLRHLAAQPEIRSRVRTSELVGLLWEACQIPDYGQSLVEHHARLVSRIFADLSGPRARVDPDWLQQSVARLDDVRGDVDTLMLRIELTRTFTYISHHPGWVDARGGWAERTEAIEARLSDALHQRLVERFVEVGRAGAARARKRPRRPPPSALAPAEPVSDHPFAKLVSLRLELRRAGDVGLADGDAWVHELVEAPFERFLIDREARISADGRLLGQLTRGPDRLRPEVRLLLPDDVGAGARSRLQRRLVAWSRDLIAELCAPLRAAPDIALGAAARGLLYQLEQGLGTVPVSSAAREVEHLTAADRAQLTGLGIVIGVHHVFARALLRPRAIARRVALVAAQVGDSRRVPSPAPGVVSLPREPGIDAQVYLAVGYAVVGARAVRVDVVERVARSIADFARGSAPDPRGRLPGWLGCSAESAQRVAGALGLPPVAAAGAARSRARRRARRSPSLPTRDGG